MRAFAAGIAAAVFAAAAAACGPSSSSGECRDSLLPGDLVITEVFADYQGPAGGSGADEGKEWFEIYNNTDRPIELGGMTVVHGRSDGSRQKRHTMRNVTIAPGQYLTLGNAIDDLLPAYVDYGYAADLGDLFNTGTGSIQLRCGSAEIDAAAYEMVRPGRSRQFSMLMAPDYTANDNLTNWCEARSQEFEPRNFGTPGEENDCAPVVVGQCTDGGAMRDTVPPEEGDLVITEVMPDPAAVSDTVGEWFEVYATRDVDLNGIGLDRAGDNMNPVIVNSAACLRAAAGSFTVFAKSVDMAMNGGIPAPIAATFNFSLVNGTAAAPGDVRILFGSQVLDAITWVGTRAGRSHQLDPDQYDPIANDDASNFCDGTTVFGDGDRGTPGSENVRCPLIAQPGMCIEGGVPRAIRKPAAGTLVITEVMPNPAGTETTREWFEITNVGSAAFDLNELGLDRAGDMRMPDLVAGAQCKPLAPGGFALFARSADPASNAMLPAVDGTFGFSMPNTAGDVRVLDGETVLDAITYGNVSAAMFDGRSLSLDPGSFTTTANDAVAPPLGAVWCLGDAPYGDGTNRGTPKAANPPCP